MIEFSNKRLPKGLLGDVSTSVENKGVKPHLGPWLDYFQYSTQIRKRAVEVTLRNPSLDLDLRGDSERQPKKTELNPGSGG